MTDQQSAVLAPRGDAPGGRPEAESPARKWTQSLSLGRYTGVVVALLVVAIYLTITEPVFLTWDNLMNIVKSNSVIFVLAIGATFVVISGGIDLSTASATTATAMIFGLALAADWALVPALAAAIGFGLMIGLINGVLIPMTKSPRLSLSAHLTAVQSGTFLIAVAWMWPVFRLANPTSYSLATLLLGSLMVLWLALFLSGFWGAGRDLPIAGQGAASSAHRQMVVTILVEQDR